MFNYNYYQREFGDEVYQCIEHIPQEAIYHIIQRKPDLLIVDMNLHGMTGLEMLRKLNAAGHNNTPFIMLVPSEINDVTVNEIMSLGAVDVKKKPFNIDSEKPFVDRCKEVLFSHNSVNAILNDDTFTLNSNATLDPISGASGTNRFSVSEHSSSTIGGTTISVNSSRTKQRVLCVDDSAVILKLLKRQLTKLEYDVETCDNPGVALELLEEASLSKNPFTIILLDVIMPGTMGGKRLLQKIREQNVNLFEPIVLMLSGLSDEESILDSLELGADEFLMKPVVPDLLKVRINAAVTKRKLFSESVSFQLIRGIQPISTNINNLFLRSANESSLFSSASTTSTTITTTSSLPQQHSNETTTNRIHNNHKAMNSKTSISSKIIGTTNNIPLGKYTISSPINIRAGVTSEKSKSVKPDDFHPVHQQVCNIIVDGKCRIVCTCDGWKNFMGSNQCDEVSDNSEYVTSLQSLCGKETDMKKFNSLMEVLLKLDDKRIDIHYESVNIILYKMDHKTEFQTCIHIFPLHINNNNHGNNNGHRNSGDINSRQSAHQEEFHLLQFQILETSSALPDSDISSNNFSTQTTLDPDMTTINNSLHYNYTDNIRQMIHLIINFNSTALTSDCRTTISNDIDYKKSPKNIPIDFATVDIDDNTGKSDLVTSPSSDNQNNNEQSGIFKNNDNTNSGDKKIEDDMTSPNSIFLLRADIDRGPGPGPSDPSISSSSSITSTAASVDKKELNALQVLCSELSSECNHIKIQNAELRANETNLRKQAQLVVTQLHHVTSKVREKERKYQDLLRDVCNRGVLPAPLLTSLSRRKDTVEVQELPNQHRIKEIFTNGVSSSKNIQDIQDLRIYPKNPCALLLVNEILELPSYFSKIVFDRIIEENAEQYGVTYISFLQFYAKFVYGKGHVLTFWNVVRKPNSNVIGAADIEPILRSLIYQPELAYLKRKQKQWCRYVQTVLITIFFTVCRRQDGFIRLNDLTDSNLAEAFLALSQQSVENVMPFSKTSYIEKSEVFDNIDTEKTGNITAQELIKSKKLIITDATILRIYEDQPRQFGSENKLYMNYDDFLWVLLAEKDRMHNSSLYYWFRVLDVDGDGYIGVYDIEYFYFGKLRQMKSTSQVLSESNSIKNNNNNNSSTELESNDDYAILDEDPEDWYLDVSDVLTQILDLVNPQIPKFISALDIKRSNSGKILFDILLNYKETKIARNYL